MPLRLMTPSSRFDVQFTRAADKDLFRFRGLATRAAAAIQRLETDPHRGHALTGTLRGARSLEFSMPGGADRAAYIVLEERQICLVFAVGAHEGFYQRAERRYTALQRLGEL